jgi:hypothetical protein
MKRRFIANNPLLVGCYRQRGDPNKAVIDESSPPAEEGEKVLVWASFFYELWVHLEHPASHRKVAAAVVQRPEEMAG